MCQSESESIERYLTPAMPAGAETPLHLHRGSDEVAFVVSGELTFKIGDKITVGGDLLAKLLRP